MTDINEVRERLSEMAAESLPPATGWDRACTDLRALLDAHARLEKKNAELAAAVRGLYRAMVETAPEPTNAGTTQEFVTLADHARLEKKNAELTAAVRGLLDALPSATTHPAIAAARKAVQP